MTSLAVGAIGLPILVALVPIFLRLAPRTPAILPLFAALLAAHVITTIIGALLIERFDYWQGASAFGFLACLYVYVFGAVYKSVSLTLLLALARRPGGTEPLSAIVDVKVPAIFDERIELLERTKWVERQGDSYVVGRAGHVWAGLAATARRLFGVTDAGLYADRGEI